MTTSTTRSGKHWLHDVTLGSMSVGAVVAGVACIDDGARAMLIRIANGDVAVGQVMPDWRLHSLMRTTMGIVVHDHPEVAAFVLIGTVLFVAMFKL